MIRWCQVKTRRRQWERASRIPYQARRRQRGSAFIIALVSLLAMLLLGTAIMDLAGAQLKRDASNRDRLVALNLAEAGADYALYQLGQNGSWTGEANHSLPQGTFSVTVTTEGALRVAVSTGQFRHATVPLRAVVEQQNSRVFSHAAFGDLSVSLSGNGHTDSYDSRNGAYPGESQAGYEGNVGSNGSITLNGNAATWGDVEGRGAISLIGNAEVYGDAQAGGAISTTSNAVVHGVSSPNDPPPYVTLPPVNFGDSATSNNNASLMTQPNWSQSYNNSTRAVSISGNRSLTLAGGVYYFSSISISGNGRLYVNGEVRIYCTGSISVAGNGIVNLSQDPTDLILQSSGTNVSITGNGDWHGAVYAPHAAIHIPGNGNLFGSVVGQSVTWSGNGDFHYDEALGEFEMEGGGAWQLRSWEEL